MLLTGDLNVGNLFLPPFTYRHSGITSFDHRLKDTTETLDLTQLITQPTRIENDTHNLRDLFFTSNMDLIINSGLLSSFSSLDHLPIFTTLSIKTTSATNSISGSTETTEKWALTDLHKYYSRPTGTQFLVKT